MLSFPSFFYLCRANHKNSTQMKKILLLGSGELGKEFVIAAQRLGQTVVACDKYAGAPAMQVADACEVFDMLDGEALAAAVEKHHPDVIVPEIEAIRTERLYDFEREGIQVVPSARAVNFTMNRKAIRDLAAKELGLKTARYFYAKTLEELREAADRIGYPCVVKPLMSSSGKGQSVVKSPEEVERAWHYGCEGSRGDIRELIVEEFIRFDSEITLLTVTQKNGPTLFCPPIGHVQKGGDYRESFQSPAIAPEHLAEAQRMAAAVTEALTGAGLWGVEFFLSHENGVYFSELSPRPHDTGMVTLAGTQNLNEFELHLRAVLGLPIPEITFERMGASAVILSPVATQTPHYEGTGEALADNPRTDLRIFGKPTARVNRRMGVVVGYEPLGSDLEALRSRVKAAAAKVKVTE
ncbi:formate-dependent phosphoribosylglycinamide formyltransferase [Alistipes sp.]|uniref:formate-dependent phosphoribosylglycinamide formyltransferase n=1 Tax=Alistipes sp. TaxID=1872444 RepID=UPI003A89684F